MSATKHPLIGRIIDGVFVSEVTHDLGGNFFLAAVLDPLNV